MGDQPRTLKAILGTQHTRIGQWQTTPIMVLWKPQVMPMKSLEATPDSKASVFKQCGAVIMLNVHEKIPSLNPYSVSNLTAGAGKFLLCAKLMTQG